MGNPIVNLEETYYRKFENNDIDTVLLYEEYCELFNKPIVHIRERIDSISVEFDNFTDKPIKEISNDIFVDAYIDSILAYYKGEKEST